MRMQEVQKKAKKLGLKAGGKKKVDLIRAIQSKDGNIPCFKTEVNNCDQMDCSWRGDCQGWVG